MGFMESLQLMGRGVDKKKEKLGDIIYGYPQNFHISFSAQIEDLPRLLGCFFSRQGRLQAVTFVVFLA